MQADPIATATAATRVVQISQANSNSSITLSDIALAVGLVTGIIGCVVAVYALYITMQRNKEIDKRDLQGRVNKTEERLDVLEARNLSREDIYTRLEDHTKSIAVLESKMGLFYGGVEEIIPKMLSGKFNPIHLDEKEQQAYNEWVKLKSRTGTTYLRKLEKALDRELHRTDIPPDEGVAAFFVLQAVKAQLIDRGELVEKTGYE